MTTFAQTARPNTAIAFIQHHVVVLNVGALALLVLMAALYIGQVNRAVSRGYAMRDVERHTQELTEYYRQSALAVSRIQTLDHVERSMKILGLVPSDRPTYIVVSTPAVALAK